MKFIVEVDGTKVCTGESLTKILASMARGLEQFPENFDITDLFVTRTIEEDVIVLGEARDSHGATVARFTLEKTLLDTSNMGGAQNDKYGVDSLTLEGKIKIKKEIKAF